MTAEVVIMNRDAVAIAADSAVTIQGRKVLNAADELALMAETLVNITSYMRRVSFNLETVGGPTDVAVISKKDGFIWIKRKHYFNPEQNYHFFNKD